jgi:hypothetical protein
VRVFKANNGKHCIDFTYRDPVTRKDVTRDERAPHHFKKWRNMQKLTNFWDTKFE